MRSAVASLRRIWNEKIGNYFWALTDQGVVSLGTFFTSIILARSLPPTEYGIFALLVTLINFLNSLHASVVITPLLTRGSCATRRELRQMVTGSLVMTSVITLPLGVAIGTAAMLLGKPEVAPWAILALIFWQFQETIRKAFIARLKHRRAAWGDILKYFGQAGLIWYMARYESVTVEDAFKIMAITSAVACLIQIFQHGLESARSVEILDQSISFWKLGRWVLLTNTVALFINQAFPWALAFFYDTAATASFAAISNILGFSNPVAFGVWSLIYPAVARTRNQSGERGAIKVGLGYGLQGGMLLFPFYLVIMVWPERVLELFYGANSPYLQLSGLLRVFVFCFLIGYLGNSCGVVLTSLERAKAAFISQLACGLAAVAIGLPLVAWKGVWGAVIGGGVAYVILLGASGFFLKQSREATKDVVIALSH